MGGFNASGEKLSAMAAMAKKQLMKQNKGDADASFDYSRIMEELNEEEEVQKEDEYKLNNNLQEKPLENTPTYEETKTLNPYDEEVFPGGPTKSQVDLWKKEWEGYDIYVIELLGKYSFVFRTLGRFEYKQLVSFVDINSLQREESICNAAVLWPENYDYNVMSSQKAGIASTLAAVIMEKSGFTEDYVIQEI